MILPMFFPMLPYVLLTLLIAYIGKNLKFGFWGNFWVALLLTPLVGIVVLLAQNPKADRPGKRQA